MKVLHTEEGYYIGIENVVGTYSIRESDFYPTYKKAEIALSSGDFKISGLDPSGIQRRLVSSRFIKCNRFGGNISHEVCRESIIAKDKDLPITCKECCDKEHKQLFEIIEKLAVKEGSVNE